MRIVCVTCFIVSMSISESKIESIGLWKRRQTIFFRHFWLTKRTNVRKFHRRRKLINLRFPCYSIWSMTMMKLWEVQHNLLLQLSRRYNFRAKESFKEKNNIEIENPPFQWFSNEPFRWYSHSPKVIQRNFYRPFFNCFQRKTIKSEEKKMRKSVLNMKIVRSRKRKEKKREWSSLE